MPQTIYDESTNANPPANWLRPGDITILRTEEQNGDLMIFLNVTVRPGVQPGQYVNFNKKCPDCFSVTEVLKFTGWTNSHVHEDELRQA